MPASITPVCSPWYTSEPGMVEGAAPMATRPLSTRRLRPRIFTPWKSAGATSGDFCEVKAVLLASSSQAMLFTPFSCSLLSRRPAAGDPGNLASWAGLVIR
ncbi:hypothetical protein D3C84_905050 [compost metagenome]